MQFQTLTLRSTALLPVTGNKADMGARGLTREVSVAGCLQPGKEQAQPRSGRGRPRL